MEVITFESQAFQQIIEQITEIKETLKKKGVQQSTF